MHPLVRRAARLVGASIGAFAGVVAIQMLRLRRLRFLPGHPGFEIDHRVEPSPVDGPIDAAQPLQVIVLGDSTAAGVGVERPEESLAYRIAQRLADEHRRAVHVTSHGWAGARVADLLRDQVPRAIAGRAAGRPTGLADADVVALVVGANDATHRTPPGRFGRDLRAVLETVRRAAPRGVIVLAGIPAFRGALRQVEPLIWITDQYARLLRRIARSEARRAAVAYADLAREVPPRIRGRRDILSPDRFHLSAAGYAVWAEVIVEAIAGASADQPVQVVTSQVAGA